MRRQGLSILGVGLGGEQRALLEHAAKRLPHGASLRAFASLEEAIRQPAEPGREVLVLADGSDAMAGRAAAVVTDGLPRWPVVVFGSTRAGGDVTCIPPSTGDAREVAHVLGQALARQAVTRELARARGDLLTIARRISHEMRSPLGCILTSADVLKEELADSSPAVQALTEPIVESANEVLELIDRLTLVARATAGSAVPEPVDMGMVVWAANERFASRVHAARAQVVEPKEWPVVVGVRDWLERIWQNLIDNALRHAGPEPRIEFGWSRVDEEVRLFVCDRGPGVPEALRAGLFRPFHRLHEADAGRGMGLAIVHRLVELQGGSCGYEPAEPHGACFWFTVPAAATGEANPGSTP